MLYHRIKPPRWPCTVFTLTERRTVAKQRNNGLFVPKMAHIIYCFTYKLMCNGMCWRARFRLCGTLLRGEIIERKLNKSEFMSVRSSPCSPIKRFRKAAVTAISTSIFYRALWMGHWRHRVLSVSPRFYDSPSLIRTHTHHSNCDSLSLTRWTNFSSRARILNVIGAGNSNYKHVPVQLVGPTNKDIYFIRA